MRRPALFAQTLMKKSEEAFENYKFEDEQVAKKILNEEYDKLIEDFMKRPKVPFGACTACIALVDSNSGKVKFVNVGDSGSYPQS